MGLFGLWNRLGAVSSAGIIAVSRIIIVNLIASVTSTRPGERTVLGYKSDDALYGVEIADDIDTPTNWIAGGTNTIEQDGSEIKFTYVDASTGGLVYFRNAGALSEDLVIGDLYTISGLSRVNAGANVNLNVQTSAPNSAGDITSETLVPFSLTFTATNTVTNFFSVALAAGEICWLSEISVLPTTQPSLLTVPTLTPAFNGMRLATTVADGAEAGAGLVDNNIPASWTIYGTNTVEDDAGEIKITRIDNNNGAYALLQDAKILNANLTIGSIYQATGTVRSNGVDCNITAGVGTTPQAVTVTPTPFTFTWVATSATTNSVLVNSMVAGSICWVADLEIKEVTPIWYSTDINGVALPDPKGLNVADAGVNLCQDSNDLTTGVWTLGAGLTKSFDQIGPDGEAGTATRLRDNATTVIPFVGFALSSAGSMVAALEYGGRQYVYVGQNTNGTIFDLIGESVFSNPGAGVGRIVGKANGYLIVAVDNLATGIIPQIAHCNDAGAIAAYTGNGTDYTNVSCVNFFTDAVAGPCIETSGATGSRNADLNSIPTPSILTPEQGAISGIVYPDETGQTAKDIISSYVDASNSFNLRINPTIVQFNKRVSAVNIFTISETYTHTAGTPLQYELYWDNVIGMGVRVADLSTDISALPFHVNADTSSVPFSSLIDLGHLNGTNIFKASSIQDPIFHKSAAAAGWV